MYRHPTQAPGKPSNMKLCTAANYVLARWEVTCAQITNRISRALKPGPDLLTVERLPSGQGYAMPDRIIGEIDQGGLLFASDLRDAVLFNGTGEPVPRYHRRLLVVARNGTLRVRKYPSHSRRELLRDRIRDWIGWGFYLEAAALLRLQGAECVPQLRALDVQNRTIEMDYIWGDDLRQALDLGCRFDVCAEHSSPPRQGAVDVEMTSEIQRVLATVIARGVVPLDGRCNIFCVNCLDWAKIVR
jgi:hypothetical protein